MKLRFTISLQNRLALTYTLFISGAHRLYRKAIETSFHGTVQVPYNPHNFFTFSADVLLN